MSYPEVLLNYYITTIPSPLGCTPGTQTPVPSVITIVISNAGQYNPRGYYQYAPTYLQSIQFTFRSGSDAYNLSADSMKYSALNYGSPDVGWAVTEAGGRYTLQAKSGAAEPITSAPLVVQFFNIHTNAYPGTFTLVVTEYSGQSSSYLTTRRSTFDLAKGLPTFSFENLTASESAVSAGNYVKLSWNASPGAYIIVSYNGTCSKNAASPFITKSKIYADTTFTVYATQGIRGTSQGYAASESITVTVSNPTLTGLTVNGATTLGGATSVGTSAPNGNANLTVNGESYLDGATNIGTATTPANLTVTGNSYLDAETTVGTASSPANLTVWGDLTAPTISGNVNVTGGLTVAGSATLNGGLTVNNPNVTSPVSATLNAPVTINALATFKNDVSILQQPQPLTLNQYEQQGGYAHFKVETDCIVVGLSNGPGSVVGTLESPNKITFTTNNGIPFVMPVPANTEFTLQAPENSYAFLAMPLGNPATINVAPDSNVTGAAVRPAERAAEAAPLRELVDILLDQPEKQQQRLRRLQKRLGTRGKTGAKKPVNRKKR